MEKVTDTLTVVVGIVKCTMNKQRGGGLKHTHTHTSQTQKGRVGGGVSWYWLRTVWLRFEQK